MGIVANYSFATLALSAKLHRMLNNLGSKKNQEFLFDSQMQHVLHSMSDSPLGKEARIKELEILHNDLNHVEELFQEYKQVNKLTPSQILKFELLIGSLRKKIKEKEIT